MRKYISITVSVQEYWNLITGIPKEYNKKRIEAKLYFITIRFSHN
jgi:hypothetical protein